MHGCNGGAQTQPTTAPTPDTPKGAIKALAIAVDSGDGAKIRDLMQAANPMEQQIVNTTADMAVAIAGLKHVMVDKFGQSAAENAMGDPPELMKKILETIDGATEKVDGDHATVISSPTQQGTMNLHRDNGVWRISVSEQAKNLTQQQVDEQVTMISGQLKMLGELTGDVSAGKYTSANDVTNALKAKMSGAATQSASQPATTQPG